MTQSQIKNIFFFLISCLLFFFDIIIFVIMQRHDMYLLLCFFIMLLTANTQNRTILTPLFLLSAMSYLEMNIFGWAIVYIMPTMTLATYLDQHLRIKVIIPYILLSSALIIKMLLGWYTHSINISLHHAIEIFTYNMIIISLFISINSFFEKNQKI